jgi:DNA-binding transcriptional LysR family regulator
MAHERIDASASQMVNRTHDEWRTPIIFTWLDGTEFFGMPRDTEEPLRLKGRTGLDAPHVLSGPYWAELRVFLAVAQAKSYTRAASALGMSQPTVGRNVKRLQDIIGAQLVVPTATGVTLTQEGELLAKSLLEVDQKLLAISAGVKAEHSGIVGTVRIAITEGLAAMFVVPNIKKLTAEYKNIRIVLKNPVSMVAFKDNQCDFLLAFSKVENTELETVKLGTIHFIPVASQEYIRKNGIPTLDNIHSHFFVDSDFYQGGQKIWSPWQDLVKSGTHIHTSENSFAYALMVRSGLGIGLLGNYALADPSAVPLDLGLAIDVPMYAYAYKDRLNSKPVRIVFDWFCQIFSSSNPLFSPEVKIKDISTEDLEWVVSKVSVPPKYSD